jgi:3-phenylpropionate/trans-cinnamate dioxygenase ferredoxin reductase subunit
MSGVALREGVGLAQLIGGPMVTGAILSDGSRLDIDVVLVGIGVEPADRLAAECGLATNSGVLVDSKARTSDPLIYAIGDCARFPFADELIRLESIQNAIDQAEAAAGNILGQQQH